MDPISLLLSLGTSIIERLWPDPTQAAEAKLKLLELQQSGELAQITGQLNINAAEASSSSVFVSGWRPFVGWVCGCGFAFQFLIGPFLTWITALCGIAVVFPQLDMSTLLTLLGGLLGLGGLRTFEKVNGVASK